MLDSLFLWLLWIFILICIVNLILDFGYCRGYVAPEYVTRGQLTEKVDTYSYGVVLMEIVTGEINMKRTPSGMLLFLVDRVSFLSHVSTF